MLQKIAYCYFDQQTPTQIISSLKIIFLKFSDKILVDNFTLINKALKDMFASIFGDWCDFLLMFSCLKGQVKKRKGKESFNASPYGKYYISKSAIEPLN